MVVLLTFWEAYEGWVCHASVTIIRWSIFFSESSFLMKGENAILYSQSQGCWNASVSLLPSLVSMHCIVEVGGGIWMQTDPDLVVPSMLQSLEKLKYLVLLWIALGVSWLPVRMYIQSTEKVNRQCNWFAKKVVLNGLADIQEFFIMCTLHFQMIWKRSLAVFLQINCYIWWSFGEC